MTKRTAEYLEAELADWKDVYFAQWNELLQDKIDAGWAVGQLLDQITRLRDELRKTRANEGETDSSSVFMPEWAPGVPDVEFVCTHGDYVDKPNGPRGNMRLVRYTRNPKEEKYVSNRHGFDKFPG
jgi:hypothetical protein